MTITQVLLLIAYFAIGVLGWTLGEYAIHNWIGHAKKGLAKNKLTTEHQKHHRIKNYFASNIEKAGAFLFINIIIIFSIAFIVGYYNAMALSVGFSTMYLIYELVHRRAHTHPPQGKYSRWIRRNHFYHHFVRANKNHGVTSFIFDKIFGTYDKVTNSIPVPQKYTIDWMLTDTGEIKQEFASDYHLRLNMKLPDQELQDILAKRLNE